MYVLECDESTGTDGVESVCSRATWHCGLLTLDSAAVWPEGALPGEQHRAMGLAWAAWDTVFWFVFEMQFTASSYISPNRLESWGRCVCTCEAEKCCVKEQVSVFTFCVCLCTVKLHMCSNLTVLIVAILHQVLVDRVGHLWLAVVPFHIHQQMVPFTL